MNNANFGNIGSSSASVGGASASGPQSFIKRLSEAMHNESDEDLVGNKNNGSGAGGKGLLGSGFKKEKHTKKNFSNAAMQSFVKEFTGR